MSDYLFVFDHTHAAIAAERALLEGGFSVGVMPVPTAIAAGCGIGLRVKPDQRVAAATLLLAQAITTELYHIGSGYPLVSAKPVFSGALRLQSGDAVALVGCGGKTTLLHRLAAELRSQTVLLATTTRILPPPESLIDTINPQRLSVGVNLLHGGMDGKKLMPPEAAQLEALCPAKGYTLLECDGSKGLPLKGWADYEPVLPAWTTVTVGICTLRPVGEILSTKNVHRPALFCRLTDAEPGTPLTLAHVAAMVSHEAGLFGKAVGRRFLFINQVETAAQTAQAQEFVSILPQDFRESLTGILIGAVQQGAVTVAGGRRGE